MCLRPLTTTSIALDALRARAKLVTPSLSSRRMRRTICAQSRRRSANDCRASRFLISTTTLGLKVVSKFRSESGSPLFVVGRQRRELDRKPKPTGETEVVVLGGVPRCPLAEVDAISQPVAAGKNGSRPTGGHDTAGAARC